MPVVHINHEATINDLKTIKEFHELDLASQLYKAYEDPRILGPIRDIVSRAMRRLVNYPGSLIVAVLLEERFQRIWDTRGLSSKDIMKRGAKMSELNIVIKDPYSWTPADCSDLIRIYGTVVEESQNVEIVQKKDKYTFHARLGLSELKGIKDGLEKKNKSNIDKIAALRTKLIKGGRYDQDKIDRMTSIKRDMKKMKIWCNWEEYQRWTVFQAKAEEDEKDRKGRRERDLVEEKRDEVEGTSPPKGIFFLTKPKMDPASGHKPAVRLRDRQKGADALRQAQYRKDAMGTGAHAESVLDPKDIEKLRLRRESRKQEDRLALPPDKEPLPPELKNKTMYKDYKLETWDDLEQLLWRTKAVAGISSSKLQEKSTVNQMDRMFGLPRGADISGTTADSIFALDRTFRTEFEGNEQEFENIRDSLPLLQLLPLVTMVYAQHHTLLECAFTLTLNGYIDYSIGYYTTLWPSQIAGKRLKTSVQKRIYDILTIFERDRQNIRMMIYDDKPQGQGAYIFIGDGDAKLKNLFTLRKNADHYIKSFRAKAAADDDHPKIRREDVSGWAKAHSIILPPKLADEEKKQADVLYKKMAEIYGKEDKKGGVTNLDELFEVQRKGKEDLLVRTKEMILHQLHAKELPDDKTQLVFNTAKQLLSSPKLYRIFTTTMSSIIAVPESGIRKKELEQVQNELKNMYNDMKEHWRKDQSPLGSFLAKKIEQVKSSGGKKGLNELIALHQNPYEWLKLYVGLK